MSSRTFKDINLSFKRHPVTNDLVVIKNEDAIKKSVKNIIFTILGEKPYVPFFGSSINNSLFELSNPLDQIRISDEIQATLLNYEPRIDNIIVNVETDPDNHELNATIQYDIIGIPNSSQSVNVLLFPARV